MPCRPVQIEDQKPIMPEIFQTIICPLEKTYKRWRVVEIEVSLQVNWTINSIKQYFKNIYSQTAPLVVLVGSSKTPIRCDSTSPSSEFPWPFEFSILYRWVFGWLFRACLGQTSKIGSKSYSKIFLPFWTLLWYLFQRIPKSHERHLDDQNWSDRRLFH